MVKSISGEKKLFFGLKMSVLGSLLYCMMVRSREREKERDKEMGW